MDKAKAIPVDNDLESLRRKCAEVEALQRLKDSLFQMFVHDFKNPLTAAVGYLELVEHALSGGKPEEAAGFAKDAKGMVERLCFMVHDLLDLGRIEEDRMPMELSVVRLREVVDENLEVLGLKLGEKALKVSVSEADGGVSVTADRKLLSRVVGNILANAVRYSPDGGEVAFGIWAAGGVAELSISNEGPKIPEEALTRVFEKFYQVKAKKDGYSSGTGLGLAFCEMVVRAFGGGITAMNNPGKGCRFVISIPAS